MNKVPNLRFKEFSGEWEEKRLGEVSDIIMGQSPSSSEYNEEFKGLPLIQGNADCKNRKIYPRMYTTEITKESFPNDIIMTVRAPVGAISFSDIHSCIGRGVCAIRNANKFIYHYLIKLEDSWDKLAQGSTFTAVNSNDIKNLAVKFPCLKEQEKIADFLSSVDKKISIVEEKLNLFNQYKKGIMQKIFSQELRFKDENGNNYPEWEKLKMKNIYKFSQGLQVEVENQFLIKDIGMERFIRIVDVTQNIDEIRYIKDVDNKYKVTYDDIFIVRYGASAGTIGFNFSGVIANNLFKLISLTDKVYSKFNYYQLTLDTIQEKIIQTSTSTSMPALSFKGIENIELNLPCLEEQKKIADFLSAIDDKIENISGNLESLKLFKKSMLQKMFV